MLLFVCVLGPYIVGTDGLGKMYWVLQVYTIRRSMLFIYTTTGVMCVCFAFSCRVRDVVECGTVFFFLICGCDWASGGNTGMADSYRLK